MANKKYPYCKVAELKALKELVSFCAEAPCCNL